LEDFGGRWEAVLVFPRGRMASAFAKRESMMDVERIRSRDLHSVRS
jgi:hypothetical protein